MEWMEQVLNTIYIINTNVCNQIYHLNLVITNLLSQNPNSDFRIILLTLHT